MSTPFRHNLPLVDVPERWQFVLLRTESSEDVEGNTVSVLHTIVTAANAEEAESRSLAVVDYDYEDDLRGAVAEALGNANSAWYVDITLKPYR